MKRRFSFKFALVLLIATLLFGGGLYGLHAVQMERNAAFLLRQAELAQEQGKLDQVVKYLGMYLAHAPGDTQALAQYALALDKLAQAPEARMQAYLVLEKVLRRDPERLDVRRRLVDLAMHVRRFADARVHLDVLLGSSPGDNELLHLMGESLEGDGKYAEAVQRYKQALKSPPRQTKTYLRLAQVFRFRFKDEKTADRTMDALVEQNQDSSEAWLARGRYRRLISRPLASQAKEKMLTQAAADLATALALAPRQRQDPIGKEAQVLLEAGEVARALGKIDQARSFLERGLKLQPLEALLYKSLATLELQIGHPGLALDWLRRGLKALSSQSAYAGKIDLLWTLALLVIDHGEQDEVGKLTARLRVEKVSPHLLDYLGARLDFKNEQWHKAGQTLERIGPLLALWPEEEKHALLLLGQCYDQLGDRDRQYSAYRRAASRDPLSREALLGMGASLLAANKIDEAIETHRKLPGAQLIVARLLIERNMRRPENQRLWGEVEQTLDELEETVGRVIVRAELLLAKKEVKKAQELLTLLKDKHPKNVEVWLALSELTQRQGQAAEALKILDEAERQLGAPVELRLARIAHWSQRGGPDAKKVLAQLTRQAEGVTGEAQRRLWDALAQAHARTGELAQAEGLYRRLAKWQPNNIRLHLTLLDLAFHMGKEQAIAETIADIQRVEGPEGAYWRFGKARQFLRQAKANDKKVLEQADTLLKAVASRRPGWSRVILAQAEVCDRSGDANAAIAKYQEAIALGEQDTQVIRRLMHLLYEGRRYQEADQLLQILRDQSPFLADLDRLGAALALGKQDFNLALSLAQKAGLKESKDYRDHLWLGQILWAAKQDAAAEAELRQAVALADDKPETWVALVHFLARTGKKEPAQAAVGKAQKKLTGENGLLPLAQCYEAIGKIAQAKELFATALKAKPEDVSVLRNGVFFSLRQQQPKEAEGYLRKIMALKGQTSQDAAWARRLLAVLLSVEGNYQRSKDALAVLDLRDDAKPGEAGSGAKVEDQRARAVVLAAQKAPSQRRQAIDILKSMLRNPSATSDDRFLLAQLYDSVGDWSKAREQLLILLSSHDDKTPYVAYYAHGLLRHKEPAEAQPWVAKLEKLEPNAFGTFRLKAFLLKAQGKAAEAVPFLKTLARSKDEYLLPVAGLLEELGQTGPAEEMYRQYVAGSKKPESVLVLATYLGRQQRSPEALDLCAKAWPTCPAPLVAQTCLLVVSQASNKEVHSARVERWFQDAIVKNPKMPILSSALAALRHMQGRSDDAETLYRQTLAQDERNPVALNNLAWLVAVRKGKGEEALELIHKAFAIIGPDPSLLDTRAVIYLTLGRHDLAVKDLEEAIIQRPSPNLYFHLAQAHKGRNPGAAAQAWRQAKNLGLREESVDPLEREIYRRLRRELERG